jgi:hypothetical protein
MTVVPAATFSPPLDDSRTQPFCGLLDAPLLSAYDYEEREHLVSGVAAVYGPGAPDSTERPSLSRAEIVPMGAVVRTGVPYTTRVVVRRPRPGTPFSGTVHVEAFHNAGEIAPAWAVSGPYIVGNRDAWVGVTVSTGSHVGAGGTASGGVELLKQVDPERYGALSLVPGDTSDWPLLRARTMSDELGDEGLLGVLAKSSFTGSGDSSAFGVVVEEIYRTYAHSYDAVTQVARAIKTNAGDSPLEGRSVERVYASGASGTAIYWSAYLDGGHHERAHLDDGSPVIDAYVTFVATAPSQRPQDAVLVSVLSEAEVMAGIAEGLTLPPDSDAPPFRQYHVPGAGHGLTARRADRIGAMVMPGALTPAVEGLIDADARLHVFDRVNTPVISAIWRHLDHWVRDGVPMPAGAHLERDPAAPDGIASDRFGNALGGIRTPWVEAPNAQYFARSPGNPLGACYRPFTSEEMKAIYGDDDTYGTVFKSKVAALVDAGWSSPADARLFDPSAQV